MDMKLLKDFFKGKKIFITGHTGFKGSWLFETLEIFGATVKGYSINYNEGQNPLVRKFDNKYSLKGNINDYKKLEKVINLFKPEIVFHLAAQPIVLKSYEDPIDTFQTNVMGALNLLHIVTKISSIKSVVIITSDKVYKNDSNLRQFIEEDSLGGLDPYSASKAALEILLNSWTHSFVKSNGSFKFGISSVRAGNVIGGWDWGENRLIPDYFRFLEQKKPLIIRNPNSTRPWQHVLDVIYGYMFIAMRIYEDPSKYSTSYNLGPNDLGYSVEEIIIKFNILNTEQVELIKSLDSTNRESKVLALNSSKLKSIGWEPKISLNKSIQLTIDCYLTKDRLVAIKQIGDYFSVN